MPRNIAIPDPVAGTTISQSLKFTRQGAGAIGVVGEYIHPGDPDGVFAFTANQLSGASQTALQTILSEVIVLFRASRGYV